jgi:Rrf2 family protein
MRISSRTRYAAIAVLHLSREYGNGPVAIRKISEEHSISVKYLENIMRSLAAAGVVRSEKGKKGGYLAVRHPKDISVYDVVHATDQQLAVAFCEKEDSRPKRLEACSMRDVWCLLGDTITEYLKSISFQDMIEKQEQVYSTLRRLKNDFLVFKGGS